MNSDGLNNDRKETTYFDVYWEGPYDFDDLPEQDQNHVLYLICGTHSLYGRNVPLYLGMTETGASGRLSQHAHWVDEEPDPVKVYLASIGTFESWEARDKIESYPKLEKGIIQSIESLLIYSHQPVYNTRSRQGNFKLEYPYVVFNTGRRSTLHPEISSLRWLGDPQT